MKGASGYTFLILKNGDKVFVSASCAGKVGAIGEGTTTFIGDTGKYAGSKAVEISRNTLYVRLLRESLRVITNCRFDTACPEQVVERDAAKGDNLGLYRVS
jgi:hypothetical protein